MTLSFIAAFLGAAIIFGMPLVIARSSRLPLSRTAPRSAAWLQLAIPVAAIAWSAVLLALRARLGDSLFAWLDSITGLAVAGALVLVAVPLCYRSSPNVRAVLLRSLFAGFALLGIAFFGYMTVGFA